VRWKAKPVFDPYKWHIKFAWYPVRTMDDQYVWLERVLRRYYCDRLYEPYPVYAAIVKPGAKHE